MDPTLLKPLLVNFGLIGNTRNEASQLSQSVYFVTTKGVKNNFQEKELSPKCSTWELVRLFVPAAATVYQEPHFWRTEGQELFAFLFDPKIFHV